MAESFFIMFKPKFDIDALAHDTETVAWVVSGEDLFSLLNRSVTVPSGWMALARHSDRDPTLARSGQRVEEHETSDVLFARETPVTCQIEDRDLRSSDGFEHRGFIRVALRIMSDPSDLNAFRRAVLGSSNRVGIADLERHVEWPLRKVLSELASDRSAAALTEPLEPDVLRQVTQEQLGPVCLAGGFGIDGTASVHFESPAYQEHCRHEAHVDRQQRRAEVRTQLQHALAAAQQERLTHVVSMLERVNEASRRHEGVGVTELLRAFSESERGEFYAALSRLCPSDQATRYAAVASGTDVLFFDPDGFEKPARRITLPDELGPLRSVSVDERSLAASQMMVGAARGVYLLDLNSGEVSATLRADVADPAAVRGGFNAAAMSDDRVFATHSALGLIAWPRQASSHDPGQPMLTDLTKGASTVREARVHELRLWFAVDESLWSLPLDQSDMCAEPVRYPAGSATLSAVAVANGAAFAGNVNGEIYAWETGQPEAVQGVRGSAAGPVESISVLTGGGVDRLVVADRGRALLLVVVGDNYICRYESGSQIVRRAAGAHDLLIAMNDNRDRLLVWEPGNPAQPKATLVIPYLTGETMQDLCLIPAAEV